MILVGQRMAVKVELANRDDCAIYYQCLAKPKFLAMRFHHIIGDPTLPPGIGASLINVANAPSD